MPFILGPKVLRAERRRVDPSLASQTSAATTQAQKARSQSAWIAETKAGFAPCEHENGMTLFLTVKGNLLIVKGN